jgi:methyl farnesoate epoxidase/farnesoate epoxidase
LIHSNGKGWKEQRRFTLRNLRDFGFGKSSLESLVLDELKELVTEIRPEGLGKHEPNVAELDECVNAAVTNVIWWLMACETEFRK